MATAVLQRPSPGSISSGFGPRTGGGSTNHQGVDFSWARNGVQNWDIYAAAAGTIVFAGYSGGFGNLTIIDHGNGRRTYYAHQARFVRTSGWVNAGDIIGIIGNTGASNGAHLHFEYRINGRAVNPVPFWDLTIGDPMSALTIVRILRKGHGEHIMYVSPTTVRITKELSTATAEDRAFEFRVARKLAEATGLGTSFDPPLMDDSPNGSWYIRNQLAGVIAGMPADFPLAPNRPYDALTRASGGASGAFEFTGKATGVRTLT